MPMEFRAHIERAMLRTEPNTLFVFGDNMAGRGFGGQAREMRGEPNAVGIPTKWLPTNSPNAFFRDDDLVAVQAEIIRGFIQLREHLAAGGKVVWPKAGIGTGLAELPRRAPAIWWLIQSLKEGLCRMSAEQGDTPQ